MGQKNNQKRSESKAAGGGLSPRAEVERLIEKERFKDAVKQGKMCYRQDGTPENHRLLEKAYFLRARQLHADGLCTAAAEVAHHLLDFGVTDPELAAKLAPLLIKLGLTEPALAIGGSLASPEAQSKLLLSVADRAVLHPEHVLASMPEMRQGAMMVRQALDLLEAGNEAGALERLRDIPRQSPFADWRYFTRGWAAFRRGDGEQVTANWERLDAERSAARLARFLRGRDSLVGTMIPVESDGSGRELAAAIAVLETEVFGEPILERMERLQQAVAGEHWTEAMRLLAPLRFALRRVDLRLAERLTLVLLPSLVNTATQCATLGEARKLVDDFTRLAEPLPIDPRWSRLWALIWEGPQATTLSAVLSWKAYIKDLDNISALTPEERRRAQALVLKHLGEMYITDADESDEDDDDEFFQPRYRFQSDQSAQAQEGAIECLEESIRIDPAHLEAHQTLIDAYLKWGREDQAVRMMHRLLETFPDQFETLTFLALYHTRRDEGSQALPFAVRARELKPLDRGAKLGEFSARVAHARRLAIEQRYDEARAEMARAEETADEVDSRYVFLARKAALELKDGQEQRAWELIEEAQRLLPEPTPLWLVLLIEAARYQLPQAVKQRFDDLWQSGLALKCKSETAATLATRLDTFLVAGIDYPGRGQHVDYVIDYIKRGSRVRYRRQDLLCVCEFLKGLSGAEDLYDKLVARGLKNFPDSPFFILAGMATEIQKKGPFRVNPLAMERKLEQALAAARVSSDAIEASLEDEIKKRLASVKQMQSLPFRSPFPGFGGGGPSGLRGLMETFAGMGFDDEFDDDEFDDDEDDRPAPRRLPAPRGGSPRSQAKEAVSFMNDPYEVLGLDRTADETEIRRRYLELVREFPPDRAPERFAEIRAAYDELRDPTRLLESRIFTMDARDSFDAFRKDLRDRLRSAPVPLKTLLTLAEAP